ncbi:MAG: DNA internalization-related competence protein ComEC/Rec2, partial [Candidatus Syntrophonatronum acetioxidans]
HLLAVSGLHMGLIALLVMGFFRSLKVGDKYAWPLLFLVLILYLFLIGFKPSAVRAVLMLFLGAGAYFFKKDKDPLTAAAFAALIILLVKPLWLFTISFQLSFMAVLALIMLTAFFESKLNFLPPSLKKIVSTTLAAQLGILPLTAYYFYEVSLGSLLANILVLPLTGLVLGLGITGLLGIVLLPPLGQVLFIVAEVLLVYITWVAELVSGLQLTYFRVNPPPVAGIFIYYLILLFLVPREQFFKGLKALNLSQINTDLKGYGDKALKLCLVFILLIVWVPAWQGQTIMTVIFLDVGQGDSIFINTSSGQKILLDAGGRPLFHQQGDYDYVNDYVGERVVVPFLRHQGVKELDLVILSHPHEDHYGGLLSVIDHFPVKVMAAPPVERDVPLFRELMSLVEEKEIPLLYLGAGDRLKIGGDYLMDFYNPPATLFQGTSSDINENSLVFKLTRGDISFLFTGDAEGRAESYMLDSGYPLKSQVLKVGHHGSNTSTGESFLEAVEPTISIIQVGQNTYGHPSPQTLERLKKKGVRVYRTDENGAITVKTDGENLYIKTFINQN